MSENVQKYNNEEFVDNLKDFNYIGVDNMDRIEGTILSIDIIPPATAGWLPCDASLVQVTDYLFLYKAIGQKYKLEGDEYDETEYFRLPSVPNSLIKFLPMRNPFILTSINALRNALKMRLLSQPGDYNRNLGRGGVLYEFIKKPLSEAYEEQVSQRITDILNEYGNLLVQQVQVVRDKVNKAWIIYITYSDLYNKFTSNISFALED